MDPGDLFTALQQPAGLIILGSVATVAATIAGDYFVRRHFRLQDRRLKHSENINPVAIVPWSRVQLSHIDIWNSAQLGDPQLTEMLDLSVEPHFAWAVAHLSTAKPDLTAAWSGVNAAMDAEKEAIRRAKRTILDEFAKQVAAKFPSSPLRAVPKFEEAQRDVYFENAVVYIVFMDTKTILSGNPQGKVWTYFGITLKEETITSGAAYLGSKIVLDGVEVARLQRQADSSVEVWQRMLRAVIDTESVRQAMREVKKQDDGVQKQLLEVRRGLAESWVRLRAECPLLGNANLVSESFGIGKGRAARPGMDGERGRRQHKPNRRGRPPPSRPICSIFGRSIEAAGNGMAVIDLVSFNAKTDNYSLIIVEERPWDGSGQRLLELQNRFNDYLSFALDGEMIRIYPDAKGKRVRILLSSMHEPDPKTANFLRMLAAKSREYGVEFAVEVLK